jgi:outer membrane protein assembly factor BamB
MDLIQAAWMIRDLGQSVSAIHICEDSSLIAGGWDGALKKWDLEGALLWSVECQDRIESILIVDELVIVTAGLHVTCVSGGEIQWSHALEGSADLLSFFSGDVIATSSVYDIEHGDFMESAIWRFSIEGELLQVDRMDEKPWFIHSDGRLIIGLGRPKCGALVNNNHQKLSTDSPVTCGVSGPEHILLGHADGMVSSLSGSEISKESESIESVICIDTGFVAALESGDLVARDISGSKLWAAKGGQITTQCPSFNNLHWCGRDEISSGLIEVRDGKGKLITTSKISKPRVSIAGNNRVAFGFEDGQVLLWEKDLFERRLSEESGSTDGRRSALAAKLRSLRE